MERKLGVENSPIVTDPEERLFLDTWGYKIKNARSIELRISFQKRWSYGGEMVFLNIFEERSSLFSFDIETRHVESFGTG